MRHLLALLSIFTFLTSSTLHAQPPSYVPANGLVGWWPFNGNANDESGNGNNGTVNGATLTQDRFGASNNAYLFSRSALQTIDVNSSISLNELTRITISVWFKVLSYGVPGESGHNHLMNKSDQSNQHQFVLANNYTGLYFYYGPGSSFYQTNILPPLNQWNNLVITYEYDGNQINSWCRFYLNGVLSASFETFNPLLVTSYNLRFGTLGTEVYNRLDGCIDDIGVWNRALIPAEIQALYTGQGSSPCVSPTAVSFTGLATSYTTSAGPVTLAGTPASGVFIGPGITGSTFSPAVAGEGTHGITYMYEDEQGCLNAASLCTSVSLGMGLEPGGNAPGGVRVFPNPNRGQFTVELELSGLVSLQVFDARGALVHNEVFTATGTRTQRTLDLSTLAKGSYTLLVQNGGGVVSQTVVVE
jgi:hypothetical protein